MSDEKELRNTLRAIKSYTRGWYVANNEIDWPEGTLGSNPKYRNDIWLAGLIEILESQGDWIDELIDSEPVYEGWQ